MEKIAVLVPCYNEELTIEKVVKDFKRCLPEATVYVYDNNSSDKTAIIAEKAGAIVRHETRQGKGYVVRKMFMDIDADIYVLVDGDDTYPAEMATELIKVMKEKNADMVNGDRLSNGTYFCENKRAFHNMGNNMVKSAINILFDADIKDVMTGFRVFNKKFVKNWPVMSNGFEIETEMTIYALDKRFSIQEVPIDYRDRPEGSVSKLNTISDGIKVLKTIFCVFKDYKPMLFFGGWSVLACLIGILCGIPVINEFLKFGYINHIPLTVLAASLEILAINFLTCGLTLDTVVKKDKENFELKLIEYCGKEKDYE